MTSTPTPTPDLALLRPTVAAQTTPDSGGSGGRWEVVCGADRVTADRGVAARVAGSQVAIFVLASGEVLAVDDTDPFSGATVLSRGIVGEVAGEPTVASPVYKQRFELRTGRCLDDDGASIGIWPARIRGDQIEVAVS